jgi:hypothetical protein
MTDQQPLSGRMLLYERPELLSKEDHGHLGLRNLAQPFSYARDLRAVPLVTTEFRTVQRHGPVVFTEGDNPVPVAVLGVLEDRNLFVDNNGQWQVPGYVPAYLRCYPFALATADTDRYALVFDRTADMIGDKPDMPFFEGAELSQPMQRRLEMCRTYQAERQQTEGFCETLKRLNLLVPQQAVHSVDGEDRVIARYLAVHRERLMTLDNDVLADWFRNGSLAAIVAHLFSLDNFAELVRLRQGRGAA